MAMDTRKATEETGDVLLVRWRYPTEPDAVGMAISTIAANICKKSGLRFFEGCYQEFPDIYILKNMAKFNF